MRNSKGFGSGCVRRERPKGFFLMRVKKTKKGGFDWKNQFGMARKKKGIF